MGNQLNIGSRAASPSQANGGITTGAIAVVPCFQSPTDSQPTNIADSGISLYPGEALVPATVFGSSQYLANAEQSANPGSDTYFRITAGDFGYTYNAGDNFLYAAKVYIPTSLPGASRPLLAQGGASTSAPGISIKVGSTGALFIQYDGSASSYYSANTDKAGPANNGRLTADAWYSVMACVFNHNVQAGTANIGIWIDGVFAYVSTGPGLSGLPTTITPTEACRVGAYYRSSGPVVVGIGARFRDVHIYRSPNSVQLSLTSLHKLANRLHRTVGVPLNALEWPMS